MAYLLARLKIRALGIAVRLMPAPQPFMLTGSGSASRLCRLISDTGVRKVLLVTDAMLLKLGVVEPVLKALAEAGVEAVVFGDVEPDPTIEIVLDGLARLRASGADAVLAVGGGSPIDAAKAIVACHANGCRPEELVGLFKVRRQGVPFFAIPTTAGTGSEITIVAVVSDAKARRKLAIIDGKLVPSLIALDPMLMLGLPPAVTAATGMDALTHAIESFVSTVTTRKTRAMSKTAVRTIMRDLPRVYEDGSDVGARERMAVASCMAGIAFTSAGVGYVHAIAHQFGALYHVPHGVANAVTMPYVLDYSLDAIAPQLAELARLCGIGVPGAGDRDLALAFIAEIRLMSARMLIPQGISSLVREDIPEIARRALAEAHGTYAVPKYLGRGECEALLARMLPA